MLKQINEVAKQIDSFKTQNIDELEAFRLRYVSKKGIINELFEAFKNLNTEEKKQVGKPLNILKKNAVDKLKQLTETLEISKKIKTEVDVTLPGFESTGSIHPLSQVKNKVIKIFEHLGFDVRYGPEIESDWNNFSALNFPKNHPARDMQDTYFLKDKEDIVLRTHTSNVQVRIMEEGKLPIRSIMPGRVYRNEAISARSHCFFHQVEGLYINHDVSFLELKNTLYHFAQMMFGEKTDIRLRPSYFPFTEPSAEIDISCFICDGKGCKICKHSGWVEIAGAGMVDPNVLENCKINSSEYSGFAFGMGIERIAMLTYSLDDIRLFSENDIRFLKQF